MDDQSQKSNLDPLTNLPLKKEEEIKISEPTTSAQEGKEVFKDKPFIPKKEEKQEPVFSSPEPPRAANLVGETEKQPFPASSLPPSGLREEKGDVLAQARLAQKKEEELLLKEEEEKEAIKPLIKPEAQPKTTPGLPLPHTGDQKQPEVTAQDQAPVIPTFVAPQAPPPPVVEKPVEKKSFFSFLPNPVLIVLGVLLLVLLGIVVFKLVGREKPSSSGGEVNLTYWGLWEPASVMQGVIAQFEKEHPEIKVAYKMQSPQEYKARLQNALNSGSGPDIFRFHPTWISLLSKQLEPVPEEIAQKLGLETNYFPVVKKAVSLNSRYYALPLGVDTLALYYNKDLLQKVGGELPRTWWGLQKLAQEITQKSESGKITTAGVALGTTNNVDHFADIIGLMLLQNGADPGKPDQLTQDVLQYYTLFAGKNKVWDKTLPSSTIQFASGKLGFYFAPSWRYFELKAQNPGLNFGIAQVPQLPESREIDFEAAEAGEGELTNITWASFWVEGVSAQSAYQKEAWQFLEYLASAEGLRQFYQAASQVRDFGEIYPLTNLASELTTNPYLEPLVKQAQSADYWYLCSDTYDAGPNDLVIKYYEDALNSFAESGPSNEALETLQAGVSQLVEQYKL